MSGLAAARPGARFSLVYASLKNSSSEPVRLSRIRLEGSGIGTIVALKQLSVVPTLPGLQSLPETAYLTDPPVYDPGGGSCHVALLRPVPGYVVKPHQQIRLYAVFQAIRVGRWSSPRMLIDYTIAGHTFEQSEPDGVTGRVSHGAKPWSLASFERPCLSETSSLRASG
jgi:hypothetical protein